MGRDAVALAIGDQPEAIAIFKAGTSRFRIDSVWAVDNQLRPDGGSELLRARFTRNLDLPARMQEPFVGGEPFAAPDFNCARRMREPRGNFASLVDADRQRVQDVEIVQLESN